MVFVWLATVVWLAVGLIFAGRTGDNRRYIVLGCLVLISAALAVIAGHIIRRFEIAEYDRLLDGEALQHVNPKAPGQVHKGVTMLEFDMSSFVDAARGLGFMHRGTVYCVAPIVSSLEQRAVHYWAAGTDCCDWR